MNPVKLCPSCGQKNAAAETLCTCCMADISGVSPTGAAQAAAVPSAEAGVTRCAGQLSLRFTTLDGAGGFSCEGGEIGRDRAGQRLLSAYPTVSRRHARLTYADGVWRIEDLHSTNGTWVNERRLETGEQRPLQEGDRLALSRSCVLLVQGERLL